MSHQYTQHSTRHYFVDEAGDSTLFDRKGHIIVGQPGCSRYFFLGFVDIRDPKAVASQLQVLRSDLLSDPYFKNVPSMQLSEGKTAVGFHAKDDLPEVRREVFTILRKIDDLRFFAIVRDKRKVVDYVRRRNQYDPLYRYNPNELYDYNVRRLFKTKLHKDAEYHICFARRGDSDRMAALREALLAARGRFTSQWGIASSAPLNVTASRPQDTTCLQVVDYFLWSLQRLYERQEERFIEILWPACRLIIDHDDDRQPKTGVYYTPKKPLNLAAVAGRQ